MSIPVHARTNFHTLLRAAAAGDLAPGLSSGWLPDTLEAGRPDDAADH